MLKKTLPEICVDFFSLVIQLRVTGEYGDYDSLFKKVQLIFDAIGFEAQKNDIPFEDIEDTKYALCALLDQAILTSDCSFKDEWSARPLELHYFGKNVAGVEFFNKLEEIRSKIETKHNVLEIYYYCLINGFEGKYRIEGAEKLKLLIDNLCADLKRQKQGNFEKLSTQWELPQSLMQKVTNTIPPWVISAAVLFVVFLVFIVLKGLIGNKAGNLISELNGIFSKL
jgi:type VI secretion system protein ImpK